jgi:hypothetical protein
MTIRLQDLHQDFTDLQQLARGVFIGQGAAYMDLAHQQIKPKKGFKEVIESCKGKITTREDIVLKEGVAESPNLTRFQGACLPLDTKCPESELNLMIPSSTPDGRTRTIHLLHLGSNNEYKLTILSLFHTT